MNILMVCLGNICRSPLAEGIMKKKVEENNLGWFTDSAGTGSWHIGELPDRRSIATAHSYGIDITNQRARQLRPIDIDRFDLILVMDSSNYRDVIRYTVSKDQEEKVQLIMNFLSPGRNENVPDPYWDDNGFETVFKMLDNACDKIVEKYSGN